MKTWSECCDEVGYDRLAKGPSKVYVYYGYKGGIGTAFPSEELAMEFSHLTEKVVDAFSEKAHDAFWADQIIAERKAYEVWQKSLESAFDYLTPSTFELCYKKAYEDGHATGYDAVYYAMEDISDFACKILSART